jgi:uncharacterized protein YkwD
MNRTLRIALLLTLTLLVALPTAAADASRRAYRASACAGAYTIPSQATVAQARATTLCLLNAVRASHGLRPLRQNPRLNTAAAGHSRDMVRRGYFSHGSSLSGRIISARYTSRRQAFSLGENIAFGTGRLGTPASIMAAWMRSPGHRANILQPRFRDVGTGIVLGAPVPGGGGGTTYTNDFGARG